MQKDNDNYWHLLNPYAKPICVAQTPQDTTFQNLAQLYANTFLASNFAEAGVYCLKTRMQKHREDRKPKSRIIRTLRGIRVEKSSWPGLSALILRQLTFNSMRVTLYDIFRHPFLHSDDGQDISIAVHHALLCSCSAGCIAGTFSYPLDIAKLRSRRLLGLKRRSTNVVDKLILIYKSYGVRGLWRGAGASCLHASMLTAGDVGAYDLCKRNLKHHRYMEEGRLLCFVSSMVAGLVASVLSHPADVIKLRIMSQPTDRNGKGTRYNSSIDCLVKLVKQQGFRNLYKDLIPCWLRLGPWSVLFWLSAEQLRAWEGQKGF